MNDLISRAKAIEALKSRQDGGKGDISRFYNTIIQNDIEAIEQLPPAPAVKVALSLLVDRFENVLSEIREINGDDTVCKWCEYNGAYIGESGNWYNVCPGFDSENCFKLKDSYRKELEGIYG